MFNSVPDFPGWIRVIQSAWRWGTLKTMRPQIIFGCPNQPVYTRSRPHEPQECWWHVPIMVKTAMISRKRIVERVTIRLVGFDKPPSPSRGISLRWYSRDHQSGTSAQDLEVGRIYMIPVVIRNEDGDGRAFITNEDWMLGSSKSKWPLSEGRHDIWIDLWSGNHGWRSEYPYRIIVPSPDIGNGPFTMEVFYGNIY